MKNQYDIFISYRRDGGAQYARILQLALQQRGYRVFLDYDELTDGIFSEHIKNALEATPVFMVILSKNALDRCVNENDWLRQEITLAYTGKKQIIPVNPDGIFDLNIPDALPEVIKKMVIEYQHSEIRFGQTLSATVDLMIKHRIEPILGKRKPRMARTILTTAVVLLVALGVIFGLRHWKNISQPGQNTENTRTEMHTKYRDFNLYLDPSATALQLTAVDKILENMSEVDKGSLWVSQFEMTKGIWHNLQDMAYNAQDSNLPMTGISYGDIYLFISRLSDLTNLDFALPSAEEWEYAAKSGRHNEQTLYVGNDNPDAVAWYKDNSGGEPHPCDGRQGKEPNMLDIFDMSGNVSELCCTTYGNDPSTYTVCGGHFNSPASEITSTSRAPFHVDAKDTTTGFRLVLHRNKEL